MLPRDGLALVSPPVFFTPSERLWTKGRNSDREQYVFSIFLSVKPESKLDFFHVVFQVTFDLGWSSSVLFFSDKFRSLYAKTFIE